MTDLPITSSSPVAAAVARPSASASPRSAPARAGTAQLGLSPFQNALALELDRALDGPFLPGLGVSAAPVEALGGLKPAEDTAQAGIATDALALPALADALALPALVDALALPALIDAPALPALIDALALPALIDTLALPALIDAPALPALADAPALPSALASVASPAAAAAAPWSPAGTGHAGLTPAVRNDPPAGASATASAEAGLHTAAAAVAADFAARGKFPLSSEGEFRREAAFDASLPQRHQAAPAQLAAIHPGSIAMAPAQAAQAPVAALETRVGERGWDQGLGDRLIWMAGHKQQVAELHLNPPDLGPLKITLTLNDDQASAQFVSAHATVRDAIESAMPRLREMLADSGITLGNASVSTGAFREQAQPQHEPRAYPGADAAAPADPGSVTRGERALRRSRGLVDTFA